MTEDSEFTTKPLADSVEVLLGSGGTADCYKRIIGNRAYCIKRPKLQYCFSEDYMNLFRKEFELGIELEHPNIVRYFDYGEDEKGPFIKMDYVDGESLDKFVATHPDFLKNNTNRQRLLNELLDALAYLHGKRMLHLDLKPSNILITNNGHHVKLVDLGFAWTDGYLHDAGFSRDYCAPEQLANKVEQISPATDIYALGKIMQRFHLAKDSVVKRCLKENPQERFQSIDALKKVLRPKRWPLLVSAALFVGLLCWALPTVIRQGEAVSVPHDTIIVMQVDTVFMPESKAELTLDDSLTLFKEELQNALASTFSYWYMMIDNMFESQPNFPKELYLEYSKFYIDKGISVSQGIIKEKINTMQLSKTAKLHYEKAAQEVIDYYLKDYRKLKKKLEKELAAEKQ
ncbi:MAG: serine/threonine protein kinase [Bacteroidales bacterium]|nr:serine/threonine protein kinase [Bacteroidales bacterium]